MDLQRRKPNRLANYDYAQNGAYFITICVNDRAPILSHISIGANSVRPCRNALSPIGVVVENSIKSIPKHVHLIIRIENDGGRTMFAPTISRIIKQFKGVTTKEIGKSIWQKGFYDHVIRDCLDYNIRWQYNDDNLHSHELRRGEQCSPVFSLLKAIFICIAFCGFTFTF